MGTCTSWGPVQVVVERDGDGDGDGDGPVSINLADIVTGKPVPPRPSIRDRVSTRDAELHGLALFPDVETESIGEWLLRTDPDPGERLLKRANSCLAMGQPEVPFPEAEERVRQFYAARQRPPLVQVERESMTEHSFRMAGWTALEGSETDFLVTATSQLARRLPQTSYDIATTEDGPRVLAELTLDGAVVARGRAAFHDDWLGINALAVAPTHRRRGLASAVLADLLDWGAVRGATTTWLHVEVENTPARAFYDALGFRTHHGCRYLTN